MENHLYNIYVEMRVSGSDVQVLTEDGNWHKCKAHPLCEVGAFVRTSGVSSEDVAKMSRESLERELLKRRLEARVSSGIRWCWCETAKDGLCPVAAKLHEAGRDYTSQGAGEE